MCWGLTGKPLMSISCSVHGTNDQNSIKGISKAMCLPDKSVTSHSYCDKSLLHKTIVMDYGNINLFFT